MPISPQQIDRLEYVPAAPLRECYLELRSRGRITPRSVCEALDIMKRNRQGRWGPDVSRLERDLGIRADSTGGRHPIREYISYDKAVRIAEALGVDPHEVGV